MSAKRVHLGRRLGAGLLPVQPEDLEREHFPDLHISDSDKTELLDLPDDGEALIRFHVAHRQHSEHDRDGKKEHRCTVTLEIKSIEIPQNTHGNGTKKKSSWVDKAREATESL